MVDGMKPQIISVEGILFPQVSATAFQIIELQYKCIIGE
jgi:hypothetical protein